MNNEDEIKVNGKSYKAVSFPAGDGCNACDLSDECFNPKVLCMATEREDGRGVIFVEKQ